MSKYLSLLSVVLIAALSSCRTDRTPPTVDELMAQIPAESQTVVGINIDSCSFVDTMVPERLLPYVSHDDVVFYTVYADGTRPVLMLRATDPVVLGEAAYDWMQVPLNADDGQHLLSMHTASDGYTTFTDTQYVWVVGGENPKATMLAVLNAPKSATAASLIHRTAKGAVADAASGRIALGGITAPVTAHVQGNTLQIRVGDAASTSSAITTTQSAAGIYGSLDGAMASDLLRHLTSTLSLTRRLAVNSLLPYVSSADSVRIEASADSGITADLHYSGSATSRADVEHAIATLAAGVGYHGAVSNSPTGGVLIGPVDIAFDCHAIIDINQDTKADTPSLVINITIPAGLHRLLSTAPFKSLLQ